MMHQLANYLRQVHQVSSNCKALALQIRMGRRKTCPFGSEGMDIEKMLCTPLKNKISKKQARQRAMRHYQVWKRKFMHTNCARYRTVKTLLVMEKKGLSHQTLDGM